VFQNYCILLKSVWFSCWEGSQWTGDPHINCYIEQFCLGHDKLDMFYRGGLLIEVSGRFRGVRGVQMHPLWRLVMYFCVNNWTSPSNDYAAIACSNNNQAQLHTHVPVPYWSPDVWLGLELLRGIQLGLPAILNNLLATYQSVATIIMLVMNALTYRKWAWLPKNFRVRSVRQWLKLTEPPFLNFSIRHWYL